MMKSRLNCVLSLLVAGAIIIGTVAALRAQIVTPTLADGDYLSPADAPCVVHSNGQSTGTVETTVRTSGPGYLAWVMISTHATGGYVTLVDTGSINNQGAQFLPPLFSTTTGNALYLFRPPARFVNGLTIDMSNANMSAAVCTRLYGTQSP